MRYREGPRRGYSLIETMVTMSIFFVIMYGVYVMIVHYGDATKTEQARMKLQQESRYLSSVFLEELKDAGSVLTLAHTASFRDERITPYFNGLSPLNNSNFPDGIIVATGDPEATTRLTGTLNAGATLLLVESATVPAAAIDPIDNPPWSEGDKGIVIAEDGYLVFLVETTNEAAKVIQIRSQPVYFSGQLNTENFGDDAAGVTQGNAVNYPKGSPVIRLSNFAIYLFREIERKNKVYRQMLRVTDTNGVADVLKDETIVDNSLVSENIWDLQISYSMYENIDSVFRDSPPTRQYFHTSATGLTELELVNDIRKHKLKQIDISVVLLTGEFGGRRGTGTEAKITMETIPLIGDRTVMDQLPDKKIKFKVINFSVEPRNYSIILQDRS